MDSVEPGGDATISVTFQRHTLSSPSLPEFPAHPIGITMKPADLELHDAQVLSWHVDVVNSSLAIVVNAYEGEKSKFRRPYRVQFAGMTEMHSVVDGQALLDNARSGNVNYWKPALAADQKTVIYLNDGCLVVKSRQISVDPVDSQPGPMDPSR